jgi:(1->4)-alpha-D-glucan 1-alpha-D-glucosylmutase
VPDFYQGTELWDFSLVDPDNRRPVDYERRRRLLAELDAAVAKRGAEALAAELMANPADDRMKLYTSATLLRFRRERAAIFQDGGYEALTASGAKAQHVFAFARSGAGGQIIVAAPRLVATLLPDAEQAPLGERAWGDTRIELPEGAGASFKHVLTGRCTRVDESGGRRALSAAEVFAHLPVAFLEPC